MKKRLRSVRLPMVLALLLMIGPRTARAEEAGTNTVAVKAVFGKDCEAMVLQEIGRAEREVRVAIYEITRPAIVAALGQAVSRHVRVQLKYDARAAEYESMKESLRDLQKLGVRCTGIRMSGDYAKMHHKFLVIDRSEVLTGSFNFTSPASEQNYENVVRIDSRPLAAEFIAEFESIRSR